ncbi:hypothetical protein CR513_30545, partial [Mucuna pruriens]
MVTMFIDTFPSPFYDKAVGSVASNFADLVTIGERTESDIGNSPKLTIALASPRRRSKKRKKGRLMPSY